jgi:hypothetical protein
MEFHVTTRKSISLSLFAGEAIIKQYPNYFGLVWFHRIDSNRN